MYSDHDEQGEGPEARRLECRVCNESYLSEVERVPRLLDCGHTVCQICLQRLFALSVSIQDAATNSEETGRPIHCPFCRNTMRLTSVTTLRRNYALSDLIESEREQRAASTSGKFRKSNQRISEGEATGLPSAVIASQTSMWQTDATEREVRCDEDDSHGASEYCTVCRTHLCAACAARTHATRTLQRHKRLPLSEKAATVHLDYARCAMHGSHPLELLCVEPDCAVPPDGDAAMRFACYVCVETGVHRGHAYRTVEDEAAAIRRAVRDAQRALRTLLGEIAELDRQIRATQLRIGLSQGASEDPASDSAREDASASFESRSLLPNELLRTTTESVGTAAQTRAIILSYFQAQLKRLQQQQQEALVTLDAHIRERLSKLSVQRSELERMMTEVHAVYGRSERLICQHNARVCVAKGEIGNLLRECDALRRTFAERADRACSTRLLDARIPITFSKDNQLHIGTRIEIRVCILGLDGAGKTSILHRLKQNEFIPGVAPTIGFNVETIEYANAFRAVHASALFTGGVQHRANMARVRSSSDVDRVTQQTHPFATDVVSPNRAVASNVCFTLWDMSGMRKVRALWKYYYSNTHAIIYVVDSADRARLHESATELHRLMQEPSLRSTALLIMANKQDLLHASETTSEQPLGDRDASTHCVEELIASLSLYSVVSEQRSWRVQPCSALTGLGVADALEWIAQQFVVTDADNDNDSQHTNQMQDAASEEEQTGVAMETRRIASQPPSPLQMDATALGEQRGATVDATTMFVVRGLSLPSDMQMT